MESKRVMWVDYIKYFCIMMVIVSHLESNNIFMKTIIDPVFVLGFFFASGYTYRHREGFAKFFGKKVKGLFIPWLILSLFDILSAHIISFNEHAPLAEELMWNFLQIRKCGDVLWFVAALFVVYIPFYFVIRLYERHSLRRSSKWLLLSVTFFTALAAEFYIVCMPAEFFPWGTPALPWHIEFIPAGLFFMSLGYLFRTSFEKGLDENRKKPLLIIALLLYIALVLGKLYASPPLVAIIPLNYVHSICGLYILTFLCKLIKENRYMLYIGANTLLVFAFHGKVYSLIQTLAKKLFGVPYRNLLSNVLTGSVVAIVIAVAVSLILIIPIWIVNRFFPFVVGKTYKKKEK